MSSYTFTSESVSEGHPDKVCDYIADSILDAHLALDPKSRVACEVLVKDGEVVLAGEISANGTVDHKEHPGLFNKSGHLGFLGHGHEIEFRDLRVKKLAD